MKVSVENARRAAEGFDWSKVDAKTDEEISRDVAQDPEAAPILNAGEMVRQVKQGTSHVRRPPPDVDVRAIRTKLSLTQAAFAARFGFSTRTIQQWEQHRRRPEGHARILLTLIEQRPDIVDEVLAN